MEKLAERIADKMLHYAARVKHGPNFCVLCRTGNKRECSTFRSQTLVNDKLSDEHYESLVIRPISQELAQRLLHGLDKPVDAESVEIQVYKLDTSED